jgi:hypothetical protein
MHKTIDHHKNPQYQMTDAEVVATAIVAVLYCWMNTG